MVTLLLAISNRGTGAHRYSVHAARVKPARAFSFRLRAMASSRCSTALLAALSVGTGSAGAAGSGSGSGSGAGAGAGLAGGPLPRALAAASPAAPRTGAFGSVGGPLRGLNLSGTPRCAASLSHRSLAPSAQRAKSSKS